MLRYTTLAFGLIVLALASPARPAEFSGELASGAWYHVEIPDGWQPGDTLVLYQHGLDFTPPSNAPGLGPLRDVMLSEGYAVAATSYQERGWALFTAIDDNRDLLAKFESVAGGAPGEVVPFGGSMGGLTALKLAEADGFPPVKGVYALCPAAGGARLWDAGIDLRLAFDAVCGPDGAGAFPEGDPPMPWAMNLSDIPNGLGDFFDYAELIPVLVPLEQCTGVSLPPALRNDAMQRRLDQLMNFAHITDENFFVTNIAYATYALSDLVRAPEKLDGHNPFMTVGVDYSSDPEIAANILRIRPDQEAAFTAFQASMRPPARPERDGGPPPAALTTPERLAEMDKRLAAREARMHDRTRATLAFYGALSPEQQRVFDALQRLRGRGGGMGGGMGGMRGRWGGGGMGRMGPPFARPPQ